MGTLGLHVNVLSEVITIERKYEGKIIEELRIIIRIGKNKRIVLFLMVL